MSQSQLSVISSQEHPLHTQAREILHEFALFAHALGVRPLGVEALHLSAQTHDFFSPHRRLGLMHQDDKGMGCVALSELVNDIYPHAAQMLCLFVRPSYRSQGRGYALIEQCLSWAHELGHSHLIFNPLGESESLRSIYSKFGFVEIPPLSHEHDCADHLLMREL